MRSRSHNPGYVDLLEPGQPICFLILSYSSLRSQLGIRTELAAKVTAAAEMRPFIEFVGSMNEIFDPNQTLKSTRVVDLRPKDET